MKLLLTGATGFLGRNVLDVLSTDGTEFELHAVSRSDVTTHPDIHWHRADFTDLDAMEHVVEQVRPTHLLNLAWIGAERREDRYHSALNHEWAKTSADVFELFRSYGGDRLVSSGSCLEYGGSPSPWDESASTEPETAYGQGKLATANHALNMQDVSVAIGRIFFTYGPHEDRRRLVADVITSLLEERPVALSPGHQRRDYLHMADVARALISLLDTEHTGVFNIGAAQSVAVAELAGEIGRQLDRVDLLDFGARPSGADTAADMTANTDRLVTDVGWKPQLNLEEGLADTISWWRNQLTSEGSA